MRTVLIIGASKGIGLETVKLALKAGHSVRALSRSATAIRLHDPKLEKLDGDALDRDTIERALVGVDGWFFWFFVTADRYCFVPEGTLPIGDVMLAQKIALETDERAALAVANRA